MKIIVTAIVVLLMISMQNVFAMSDYESGYEHDMNDASAGCNPNGCHAMGAEMKYLHDNGFTVVTMKDLGYDEMSNHFCVKNTL